MDFYIEQVKRSGSDIIDDYDNSKKKKISITTDETNCLVHKKTLTDESITIFENLSNEIFYEIFEFLDFHHAFQSFYKLNKRFQNLFVSNLPIKINISSISKSTFGHYLTHIIKPHTNRIKSLRLSNPFAADMCRLLFPIMANFTRLETIIINDIESNYIEMVVNHLSSLPVLSSLTITSSDYIRDQNAIYEKIFLLPALKYCQLSIETKQYLRPLPIAKNVFSSIEHLVIKNKVSLNQVNSLLSYVPQLRRLSLDNLDGSRNSRTHNNLIFLSHLIDVSLKLYSVSFDDFELLVTDFFRQLQVLRVIICTVRYHISDMQYLNADRWERLISNHMVNLSVFDFQHQYRIFPYNDDRTTYEALINKFNSLFWMKRQWFFEYQYQRTVWTKIAIFYSTNPYKRKHYVLYKEPENNICSYHVKITEDSVRHVSIHSTEAMERFVGNFSNATELTLSERFHVPRNLITTNLNCIIPLQQLTKLNLGCHRFHFEQVIELLHSTPNIRILKLDSVLLYGTNSFSIEQNDIFQLVSNGNTVTNLTIDQESTLEKIELLVALFPRLEYLTINVYKEDLEAIARFLLSKFNDNTRHLSSLCISKQRRELIENLRLLIESEKLLDDYTLKVINRKSYLWW